VRAGRFEAPGAGAAPGSPAPAELRWGCDCAKTAGRVSYPA
jgi:hypothetical protein